MQSAVQRWYPLHPLPDNIRLAGMGTSRGTSTTTSSSNSRAGAEKPQFWQALEQVAMNKTSADKVNIAVALRERTLSITEQFHPQQHIVVDLIAFVEIATCRTQSFGEHCLLQLQCPLQALNAMDWVLFVKVSTSDPNFVVFKRCLDNGIFSDSAKANVSKFSITPSLESTPEDAYNSATPDTPPQAYGEYM